MSLRQREKIIGVQKDVYEGLSSAPSLLLLQCFAGPCLFRRSWDVASSISPTLRLELQSWLNSSLPGSLLSKTFPGKNPRPNLRSRWVFVLRGAFQGKQPKTTRT